jgi:hypothetical protein
MQLRCQGPAIDRDDISTYERLNTAIHDVVVDTHSLPVQFATDDIPASDFNAI